MKSLITAGWIWVLMMMAVGLRAQKSITDSTISLVFVNTGYEGLVPKGDMGDRFGYTNGIGVEAGVKFSNNFYVYTGLKFLFGTDVKEKVAQNVTFTQVIGGFENTMALGADGRTYRVLFFERGLTMPLMAGKVFPVSPKSNPNGGIYTEAGLQFLQHKIRIESQGNNVPSLGPDYRKGYDRLTNGVGLAQGVGYKFVSNRRYLNFTIGFHAAEVFTQNRRDLNYDTGVRDDTRRVDVLLGMKVGWTLLIFPEAPSKEYYY
jgi:hypothetical protein